MNVTTTKPEYEHAVKNFFKLNTLSITSSLSINNDDDLEALVIEVTHKIRVAACLRATRLVPSLADRELTLLDMCYLTVQIEDNGSNRTVERIQNASVEERNIFNYMVIKVAACFGLENSRDISAPALLFGIKPIHESILLSIIPETEQKRKELEKLKTEKIRKELEKLISYRCTYSFSEKTEIGFLRRIDARIKKINNFLENSSSSSSSTSSSAVITISIPPPMTPPTTPPMTPEITPLTSPSMTPPMTPTIPSLIPPSTTPPMTPTTTTLIPTPIIPPIIPSATPAESR